MSTVQTLIKLSLHGNYFSTENINLEILTLQTRTLTQKKKICQKHLLILSAWSASASLSWYLELPATLYVQGMSSAASSLPFWPPRKTAQQIRYFSLGGWIGKINKWTNRRKIDLDWINFFFSFFVTITIPFCLARMNWISLCYYLWIKCSAIFLNEEY